MDKITPIDTQTGGRVECFWDSKDNLWGFRGSSFGSCLHGAVMSLRGSRSRRPNVSTRTRFKSGSDSEERIKELLRGVDANLQDDQSHYTQQRKVHLYGDVRDEDYRISCSLDGWSYNLWDFIQKSVGPVYDPGLSISKRYWEPFDGHFVFEHKSVQTEKWQSIFGHAGSSSMMRAPGLFCSERFRAGMRTYAWQVSAQAHALAADLSLSTPPPILISLEEVIPQEVEGETTFIPNRRALVLLGSPPYSAQECLGRCATAVDFYRKGNVPSCDSEWQCYWDYPQYAATVTEIPFFPPASPDAVQELAEGSGIIFSQMIKHH